MRLNRTNERRGIILLVVLSLLTLFAIVGITFVLYADSEAASARVAREAEVQQHADVDPQQALAFFLGQLIYDVPDATGSGSGLRGHGLARNMYGYNPSSTTGNVIPFNGVGRLHTNGTNWPYMNPYNIDDQQLVNYTWFQGDSFARDPEWYGPQQASPGTGQGTSTFYVGGNAPYTYPDLNNFFLAAVRSDGTVITPSFHRPWLFGGTLASSNGNWTTPQGKYLTLRPRPQEHPNFPYPDDPYGDVKNLVGAPGGNDSIWIDLGAPVMTAPDGTQYKMLFAPLIMDLDNRINLGTAGNILGPSNASTSNQGLASSEVNLTPLWSTSATPAVQAEWQQLFTGRVPGAGNTIYGKYGPNGFPANGGVFSSALLPTNDLAHVYAPIDLDGRNEMAGNVATGSIYLPGTNANAPAATCIPYFPPGYGCGSTAELTNHPAAYAPFKSLSLPVAGNDDIVFRPSDMEAILRPNSQGQQPVDTGSAALIANLLRLAPQSLAGTGTDVPQRRNWITTLSADLMKPGLSPWIFNPADATTLSSSLYAVNAATPSLPPSGSTVSFPGWAQRQNGMGTATTPPTGSDFGTSPNDWRAAAAALGRIDLNRPLPPFPHMLPQNITDGNGNQQPNPAYIQPNARYDSAANSGMAAAVQTAFQLAMQARQQLALDIYNALLQVTGANIPFSNTMNPALMSSPPTASDLANLATRRWLAQLAVNIVDYIDADDISTPFNFYSTTTGQPASPTDNTNSPYQVSAATTQVTPTTDTIPAYTASATTGIQGNPDVPSFWVFGTELPRIVINEVLGEYTIDTDGANPPTAKDGGNIQVNLWVELFNPMPTPATVTQTQTNNGVTAGFQPQDSLPVPLYMPAGAAPTAYSPYQLLLANNGYTTPAPAPAAAAATPPPAPTPAANSNGLWYDTTGTGINNNVLGTPQYQYYSGDPTTIMAPVPATPAPAIGVTGIAGCDFVTGVTGGQVGTVTAPATPSYSISSTAGGLYGGLGSQPLVAGQSSMLLVGPSATDVNNDITVAAGVPGTTPLLQSPSMTYKAKYTATTGAQYPWSITVPPPPGSPAGTAATSVYTFDYINGVSVLLRRLANPYLPPNPFTSAGTLTYPNLPPNPYITVDYAGGAPLNGYGSNGTVPVPLSGFNAQPYPNNSTPATAIPPGPGSYGKLQPYAAFIRQVATTNAANNPVDTTASQYAPQATQVTGTVNATGILNHHTLGSPNAPNPPTATTPAPYTWLVHLDRKLISPMELLHVSGFYPHLLTQRFVIPSTIPDPANPPPATIANPQLVPQPYSYTLTSPPYPANLTTTPPTNSTPFQHYAPWFNQANRLYRIFELLQTHDLSSGVSPLNGRVPGKININTLWDNPATSQQIYQAICDPPQVATNADNPNFTAANVNTIFQTLLTYRTPNIATPALSGTDNPFMGMAVGVTPPTDPQYPNANGMGINNTLFTSAAVAGTLPTTAGAQGQGPQLQLPNAAPTNPQIAHPYLQNEMLTKVYNRLTTRSNVFAVFVTVGFFQVTGTVAGSPNIPQLGPEIGRSEGRQVRHRMFAIVDRTQLAAFSTTSSSPVTAATSAWQPTPATITLNAIGPIGQGSQLVLEPGTANEEVVVVTQPPSGNAVTANCLLQHPNQAVTGNPSTTYQVILRGNPGPQTVYDPRNDPLVVPYFSLID